MLLIHEVPHVMGDYVVVVVFSVKNQLLEYVLDGVLINEQSVNSNRIQLIKMENPALDAHYAGGL